MYTLLQTPAPFPKYYEYQYQIKWKHQMSYIKLRGFKPEVSPSNTGKISSMHCRLKRFVTFLQFTSSVKLGKSYHFRQFHFNIFLMLLKKILKNRKPFLIATFRAVWDDLYRFPTFRLRETITIFNYLYGPKKKNHLVQVSLFGDNFTNVSHIIVKLVLILKSEFVRLFSCWQ